MGTHRLRAVRTPNSSALLRHSTTLSSKEQRHISHSRERYAGVPVTGTATSAVCKQNEERKGACAPYMPRCIVH